MPEFENFIYTHKLYVLVKKYKKKLIFHVFNTQNFIILLLKKPFFISSLFQIGREHNAKTENGLSLII